MSLRAQIIRLAHGNPVLRPHLLPMLQKKQAAKDTADFVLWALRSQSRIPTDRVIQFLERNGVELAESAPTKRGLPLAVGELVEVQAANAPSDLQDILKPYNLKRGTVVQVDGEDVVIKMEGGQIVRVPGGVTAGKTSGIYRTSLLEDDGKASKHFEVVYLPANEQKPSLVALERLQEYVERGLAAGEERSANYFSGFTPSYKISKAGNPFFMLWTQQRGGSPRTLSPDKGEVYYIGIVGKRPSSWKADLKTILEEEGATTEA